MSRLYAVNGTATMHAATRGALTLEVHYCRTLDARSVLRQSKAWCVVILLSAYTALLLFGIARRSADASGRLVRFDAPEIPHYNILIRLESAKAVRL